MSRSRAVATSWASLVALAVLGSACAGEQDCSSVALLALEVTVTDSSGAPVCDAVVAAVDGDFSEQLQADPASPCTYRGVAERAGTYTVTAELDGSMVMQQRVVVAKDACHVVPAKVALVFTY